jgi:hypothetical protein
MSIKLAAEIRHFACVARKVAKIIAPTIWFLNKSKNMKLDEPIISKFRSSPHIDLSFDPLFCLLLESEQERTKHMLFGSSDGHLGDCAAHSTLEQLKKPPSKNSIHNSLQHSPIVPTASSNGRYACDDQSKKRDETWPPKAPHNVAQIETNQHGPQVAYPVLTCMLQV